MSDAFLFDVGTVPAPTEAPAPSSEAVTPAASSAPRSLYNKYRPRSFAEDDLVGQEHVVNTLRNAIALGRIAHAYLFCGPRGTGKTTTARLLAKAVNCLAPDPLQRPCNVCEACVAIKRSATTDVIEIDAASNRGIDDIRDLRERVKYAPSQLRTKFYIIDEAHQITGAAANAFLKTLEEPPAHTRFVLATTDPEELLPTIVSRCQRFDFRRIGLASMEARLHTVAEAEQIAIDDDALVVIARHATGSLRDALGILDQVAVYRERADHADGSVTADLVRTVLGVSRSERVEQIISALADRDAAAALRVVNAAFEAGEDIRQLGRLLVQHLRLMLLTKAGGGADADEGVRQLAERFDLVRLADLTRRLADIDYRVKHATFAQLPLELALIESCLDVDSTTSTPPRADVASQSAQPPTPSALAPSPSQPRTALRDRVRGAPPPASNPSPPTDAAGTVEESAPVAPFPASVDSGPQPASVANGASREPVVSADGALAVSQIVDLWAKIRNDVKAVNRRVEALLQQVDPVHVNGETIVLTSPYEFHRKRLNSDEVRPVVEDVISRLVSRRVLVSCVAREEVDALLTRAAPAPVLASPADALSTQSAPVPTTIVEPVTAGDEAALQSDDEIRLQAAKNIFDAEEIDDEDDI